MLRQNENDPSSIKNALYEYAINTSLTQLGLHEFQKFIRNYSSLGNIRENWLYNALQLTAINDNLPVMHIIFECYPKLDVNRYSHIIDNDFPNMSNITTYKSLILQAIGSDSVKVLDYLVNNKNADLYETCTYLNPLHIACESNKPNSLTCLKILAEKMKHVDIIIERYKEATDRIEHWSPLMLAALANNTKKVKYLLSMGADPNLIVDRKIALDYAAHHRNIEMFNLFLRHPKLSYHSLENIKFPELDQVIKIEYTIRKASQKFNLNLFKSRQSLIDLLENSPSVDEPEDSIRKKEHRAVFSELDRLVYEILNVIINYDYGTNENRSENIKKLLQLLNPVYDNCCKNLSAKNIQEITENLCRACYKIKLDVENDHFANKHVKFTESRLATKLDEVILNNNNMLFNKVSDNNPSQLNEFDALINCIKLPEKWTPFFQNNLILSDNSEETIKFYNNDSKMQSLQLLAAEINKLKNKLKNNPDSFKTILNDLSEQIKLTIKANKSSTLFSTRTARHLQAFLDNHLQPQIKEVESKSYYGADHLARPALIMRPTSNEDVSL